MDAVDDDARQLGASPPAETGPDSEPHLNGFTTVEEKSDPQPSPLPSSTRTSTVPNDPDEDWTTKALQFLATATPVTLGGIAVGLGAVTYFILGQIGLLLIGAFGGIVLFISYEARHPEVSRAVRGEKGTDVIQRLRLERSSKPKNDDGEDEDDRLIHSFDDFQPETREALTGLVDAIIRDYVKWWYTPIVPSDRSFPLSSRKLLNSFLLSISNHLSRKRPADSFLDFLTNSSSMVIVFFSELSAAFSEVPSDAKIPAADIIYSYLAENPDSNLANLLSQPQQASKFRMVAEDLLGFLDRSAYDCDPARVFLREVMAGVVLELTLQTCSKPDWINSWIVYLLEEGEPDFNQAIDVGMQTKVDTNNNAFFDMDGNVGNIGLTKGNRSSFELEKTRRKDSMAHRKKLSKADEEMEVAMEEMKRMNQMIVEEEARRAKETSTVTEERVVQPVERQSLELDKQKNASTSGEASPTSQASVEKPSTDGSNKGESLQSPITPRSTMDMSSQNSSPKHDVSGGGSQFTSFDQIVPPAQDEPEQDTDAPRKAPLTLHNANFIIHDDATNDKGRVRSKPTWDYLVQIEPASPHHPGWMIVRKYSDFETLHEILRRIATISGATAFNEQHATLPNWKMHTRASLRGELERYIRDACWFQSLAESEGLKRFLEKDHGHRHNGSKSGFGWDVVGKNMLDVLTIAPKGAMEGGKTIVEGVTGVFNNIGLGPRKLTNASLSDIQTQGNRLSTSTPPRMDSGTATSPVGPRKPRDSLDSQRSSIVSTQPGKMPPMDRRPSYDSRGDPETESLKPGRSDRWERTSTSARGSREHSRASSLGPLRSPSTTSLDAVRLPPPPDEMPEDYESPVVADMQSKMHESILSQQNSFNSATSFSSPVRSQSVNRKNPAGITNGTARQPRQFSQLTEQETRVAVELVFAIINEMYTLSSAWNIRRTLLAAAKSFLLRPGNPSLISIQSLMQQSVIEANASDAGIAAHLRKLRENTLPTDEERAAWPAESTQEEKDKLRIRARKLLIQSGVPAALMGVMGQSATSEALGRVFDCLQIEEVARGLMFGIMLQAVRVVTH